MNVFKEAKKVQRQHPRLTWQQAIQKASKQVKRKSRKVGATKKSKSRQTGTSNKAYDQMRCARPPGARIPRGGTKVTYYERRKNRSDKPGQLTGLTAAQLKAQLRARLLEKENAMVVKRYRATRKPEKRKLGKELTKLRAEVRKYK